MTTPRAHPVRDTESIIYMHSKRLWVMWQFRVISIESLEDDELYQQNKDKIEEVYKQSMQDQQAVLITQLQAAEMEKKQ